MSILNLLKQKLNLCFSILTFLSLGALPISVFADPLPIPNYRNNPPSGYSPTPYTDTRSLEINQAQQLFITIPPQQIGTQIYQPQSLLRIVNPLHGEIFKDFTATSPSIGYISQAGYDGGDLIIVQVRYTPTVTKDLIFQIEVTGNGTTPVERNYSTPAGQALTIDLFEPALLVGSITINTPSNKPGTTVETDVPNEQIIYRPGIGYTSDQIVYTVCYLPLNTCTQYRANITITNQNPDPDPEPTPEPPVAVDDTISTTNQPITINVLSNDTTSTSFPLLPSTLTITSQPVQGTASIDQATGSILYIPTSPTSTTDTLTYQICNIVNPTPSRCDTATVTINIQIPNPDPDPEPTPTPPIAVDDTFTLTNYNLVNIPVLANDSNLTSPAQPQPNLTLTGSQPIRGTATINAPTLSINYQPTEPFLPTGTDSFGYQICNADGCDIGQVTVTYSIPEETETTIIARPDSIEIQQSSASIEVNVLANDESIPANGFDMTSFKILDQSDLDGVAEINTTTNQIIYTPNGDFSGVETFTYEICSITQSCSNAVVTITIQARSIPPQPIPQPVAQPIIDVAAPSTEPTIQNNTTVSNSPNPTDTSQSSNSVTTNPSGQVLGAREQLVRTGGPEELAINAVVILGFIISLGFFCSLYFQSDRISQD